MPIEPWPTGYLPDPFSTQKRSVAVSERLNRVYVARAGSNGEGMTIDVLDGSTDQVRGSIVVGPTGSPDSPIAVDDTRRRIYVGVVEPVTLTRFPVGQVKVVAYDADSETLVDTFEFGERTSPSLGIALNPVLGRLYVRQVGRMTTVDTATNTVIASQAIENVNSVAVDKRSGKFSSGGAAKTERTRKTG